MKWLTWNNHAIESLGLDIKSTSITLLYLVKTRAQCQIKQAIFIPIQQHRSQSLESATIVAIKKAVSQLKTSYRKVNIAVSDVMALSRTFTLDTGNIYWKKAALLMMAPDIPISLDKAYWDFEAKQIFEQSGNAQVLGVACPHNTVDRKLKIIANAGLQAKIIELESHAIERTLHYLKITQKLDTLSACIYITVDTITILLWLNGAMIAVSSHGLMQDAHHFAIAQQLQQALSQLLFTSTIQPLKTCYFAGNHPLRLQIAALCQDILGLQPFLFKLKPAKDNASTLLANHNLVAFGLALRE